MKKFTNVNSTQITIQKHICTLTINIIVHIITHINAIVILRNNSISIN